MIHQFDHRWASYRVEEGKMVSANVPLLDKQDPTYAVLPRYWVEGREVHKRIRVKSVTGRNPHHPPITDPPGPSETPSSLHPSQTLRDGDARANVNIPSVRPSGSHWAERPRSSIMRTGSLRIHGAKSPHTHETGSLPFGDSSLVGPTQRLAGRSPMDVDRSGVCSSTDIEASDHAGNGLTQSKPSWLMGWRDITRSVEKRTMIADIIPVAAVGHQFLLMFPDTTTPLAAVLLGCLNSFVYDFVARQKISGVHIPFFTMNQTATLAPNAYSSADLAFVVPRVLELLYTGDDLRHLARDCGSDGPPFRWDEERRFLLRCEIDAAFFHLYLPADANHDWRPARRYNGCSVDETTEQLAELTRYFSTPRDAVAHILDTFTSLRRDDEAKHGEYRTKRFIIEIYDAILKSLTVGDSH